MTNEETIPEPDNSGADGEQRESEESLAIEVQRPYPIVDTVQGLAATKSRAFGGEITSALVAGVTGQLARELEDSKTDVKSLREKNEKLTQELSECAQKKGVLSERLDSYRANRHLANIGIVVGTGLLGAALQLADNRFGAYAILSGLTGCILLFFGWFHAPKGGEE